MIIDLKGFPEIKKVEEASISFNNNIIGWQYTCHGENGPIGSGVSSEKNIALRISIAEAFERLAVNKIAKSDLRIEYGLDIYGTTCGFAAGFDKYKTKLRSISEAIERWAWSKWIDDGYFINKVYAPKKLTLLGKYFQSHFDEVLHYQVPLILGEELQLQGMPQRVFLSITLGIKNNGIFPGSRIHFLGDEAWEHPLLEAWRHLKIYESPINLQEDTFVYGKIRYFGNHVDEALSQVNKANKKFLLSPELRLLKSHIIDNNDNTVFIWRSLMKNYIGWDQGEISRFVY
ncbi:MAG: hypothetical protein ACK41T_05120 [Pseudobdellovibrio sp.]